MRFRKRPNSIAWPAALLAAWASSAIAQTSSDDAIPLRVVTFNAEILTAPSVRAGSIERFRFTPAREAHLERVAGIIEALQPDVFNLVEVTSREAVDRLIQILHDKGLSEYRGFHAESSDTFTGMDIGVISRHALDEVDGRAIRSIFSSSDASPWREDFSFVDREGELLSSYTSLSRNSVYYLTIGPHRLGFVGLHLKANPSDSYSNARREAEARIVQRILRQEVVDRGYAPIVLGDLNDYDPDVPDADGTRHTQTCVLRNIKDFDPDQAGSELFNAARNIVRQADRYTSHWDYNENRAADSDDVYTMLDHVLLARELMPYVHRSFIARVNDLSTSDHFPVVVDLRLPRDRYLGGRDKAR